MKKYQLTGQPIYVGEIYNHNGDLYRVESFDEGYTEPKVTLRRIKDGTIFDVEAPALFLTPTGVQYIAWADTLAAAIELLAYADTSQVLPGNGLLNRKEPLQ